MNVNYCYTMFGGCELWNEKLCNIYLALRICIGQQS